MKKIKQNPSLSFNAIRKYLDLEGVRGGMNYLHTSKKWFPFAQELQFHLEELGFRLAIGLVKMKGWMINGYYSKGDNTN